MANNCPKSVQNGHKLSKMAKNQLKKMAKNWPKWPKSVKNGHRLSKMAKNCPKWLKIDQNGQNQTEIKLILPGKTEPEVHQLTLLKIGPPEPPSVSARPER
jgi:hypothetical protein